MADTGLQFVATINVGQAYTVPQSQEILIKAIRASYNGSGASGQFVPTLQIVAPGGLIVAEFTADAAVAAGASADVTWFPGLAGGKTGGGGGPTGQAQVRVPIVTPDNTSYAVPSLSTSNGFTNARILFPFLTNGHDSSWQGTIPVPQNYASTPQMILTTVTQATTGVVRWFVSTSVIAAGSSLDGAWTDETPKNVTVPGTTLVRQDTTFSLSTVPVPGSTLNVKVTRNGANAADTCTSPVALWEVLFQFNVG